MLSYFFKTDINIKENDSRTSSPEHIEVMPEDLDLESGPEQETMKRDDLDFESLKEELIKLRERVTLLKKEHKELQEAEENEKCKDQDPFLFFKYIMDLHNTLYDPITQCLNDAADSIETFLNTELGNSKPASVEQEQSVENEEILINNK